MSPEAFCPEHGPYDAALGACPYPHAGAQAARGVPISLEDDLPTDLGTGGETPPTALPGRRGGGDEGETELPAGRRSGRAVLDYGAEDETDIPRGAREEDVTELVDVSTPVLGLLWVKEGPRRGKYYPVKHGTVVGRKEGSLILDDPKVSSMHAKFTIEGDEFIVWDFGSANGTYVNGKKIREATTLNENDIVKIGDSVFVIKMLESKPKRAPARANISGRKSGGKKPR